MTAPMPDPQTSTPTVPRYLVLTKWIWIAGMAISLLGLIVATVMQPHPALFILLGVTVVMAAVAIPAAITLSSRKRWARMTLMVLAVLSIGSLYQAFKLQNWPSLVLNLAFASTLGFLQAQDVREFFGLPPQRGRASRTKS